LPGTKILRVPIRTFYVTQSFFSSDLFRFWRLGYPGSGDHVGGTILALRTFPQLVWRSEQNLVEIGTTAHGHRYTHRYKQSVLYIKKKEDR